MVSRFRIPDLPRIPARRSELRSPDVAEPLLWEPTHRQPVPQFYTEWFYAHSHHGVPPVFPGNWLVTDRPPLQIAYALSQRGVAWDDSGLSYQLLGVLLQQLWLIGLWSLLVAARLSLGTRALCMLTVSPATSRSSTASTFGPNFFPPRCS